MANKALIAHIEGGWIEAEIEGDTQCPKCQFTLLIAALGMACYVFAFCPKCGKYFTPAKQSLEKDGLVIESAKGVNDGYI